MNELDEVLRERYPDAERDPSDAATTLEWTLRRATPDGLEVRWRSDGTADEMRFELRLPDTERRESFAVALGRMLAVHLPVVLTGRGSEDGVVLDVDTTRPAPYAAFDQLFDALAAIAADIASGMTAFEALGRCDAALAAGESVRVSDDSRGATGTSPTTDVESESSREADDHENRRAAADEAAPASESPVEEGKTPARENTGRSRHGRRDGVSWYIGLADADGEHDLALALSLDVDVSGGALGDAVRHQVERRCGVELDARTRIRALDDTGFEEFDTTVFAGVRVPDADATKVFERTRAWLERTAAFLGAGLPVEDVLDMRAPPRPSRDESRRARPPRSTRPARAPREPTTRAPTGERVDVWLRTPGYSSSRMYQVISVLLSVDVIAARDLCESAPCLLMPNVSASRGVEIRALVKRAGGKAVLVDPGVRPDFA